MKKLLSLALALTLLLGFFAACGTKPALPNEPLSLGEKYLLNLDYDQALAQLEEAVKIEPKNPRIKILIEYIYVITEDGRADPDKLAKDRPDLFPAPPPMPVDEPTRVNWLLALIEALRKLNIRDLAFELLKRLAAQFPGYEQVLGAYHALAGELGIAAEDGGITAKAVTTAAATTTQQQAFDLNAKTMYLTTKELAKALGCAFAGTEFNGLHDDDKYVNNETGTTLTVGGGRVYIDWATPAVTFYGVSVGDSLRSGIQKIPIGDSIEDDFYGGKMEDNGYSFYSGGSNTHFIETDENGIITKFAMRYYTN
ncbi:MAG: hypothetical protein FWC27_12930 [Firmicutes bacterium]|nr:hypothetical protein [Bacillota bacterium]